MANEIFNSPVLPGTPVERHEHRRLMIILIGAVLFGILILGLCYLGIITPVATTAVPPNTPSVALQMDKSTLMNIVAQASTTPLSSSEKQAIFESLKGAKAQQYNLTKAEQAEILKALNK